MTCMIPDCDLEKYNSHDECILHCEKSLDMTTYDGFLKERIDFIKELRQLIDKDEDYSHFYGIHFPRPDDKGGTYNYINILKEIKEIHFDNCHFYTRSLALENTECFFQDCTFHTKWSIYNYNMLENIDDVIYQTCNFKKGVENYTSNGKISHSQFDYTCKIENGNFENTIFEQPLFNANQDNYKKNIFKNLIFKKCEFNIFELYLLSDKETNILFDKCTFKKILKIKNIEKCDKENKIDCYEKYQLNKAYIGELKIIDCIAKDNVYLRIGFLEINNFLLSNLKLPNNAELNIGDCHLHNFELSNFRNIGILKLYKINTLKNETNNNETFNINNTSIGNADFQSLNLTSFKTIIMFDIIFSNVNYINVKWGGLDRDIEVGECEENTDTQKAKKKNTYRILKNVAIKNNDQPQALIFYQKEMDNHWSITKWKKEFSNKLMLAVNKYTNNFGLNWWLPILMIFGISVIFYYLLLGSLGLNFLNVSICELIDGRFDDIFTDDANKIFEFLNPTHKVEFIAKGYWNGWTYFLDFSFRIIESLLAYQSIQALRKYSRKL